MNISSFLFNKISLFVFITLEDLSAYSDLFGRILFFYP